MLRKTVLIAAVLALLPFTDAFSQDLLKPSSLNVLETRTAKKVEKIEKSKNLSKDVNTQIDVPTSRLTTNTFHHTELFNTVPDRYLESEITKPNTTHKIICDICQINSHQLLISNEGDHGQMLLSILDNSGKLVFNDMINLNGNVYFDLDFLEAGEYKVSLVGAGFHKTIQVII